MARNDEPWWVNRKRRLNVATISNMFGVEVDCQVSSWHKHVDHVSDHSADHQRVHGHSHERSQRLAPQTDREEDKGERGAAQCID